VEVIPGNPASRTDVRSAIRDGLVRMNPYGQLEDVAGAPIQQPQPPQQQPQPLGAQPQEQPQQGFNAEHLSQLDATIAGLPSHAVDSAQARLVALLAHGTGSVQSIASQLAEQTPGMDPARAVQLVQQFEAVHANAVAAALEPLGVDVDKVIAEMRQRPTQYQNALQTLFMERSPRLFVEAAKAHAQRNTTGQQNDAALRAASGAGIPPVPSSDQAAHEAFEKAGFQVGTHASQMYLSKDGGQSWVAANVVMAQMMAKLK
jgi:hypothetical protein